MAERNVEAVRQLVRSLDDFGHGGDPAVLLAESVRVVAASELGEGALRWVAALVDQVTDELIGRDDADLLAPWDENRRFAQTYLVGSLRGLVVEGGDDEVLHAAGQVVSAQGFRDIVWRSVPLRTVLQSGARFHQRMLTALVDHATARDTDESVLRQVVGDATTVANEWAQAYAERYVVESRRMVDSMHARGRATVEALVEGRPVDGTLVAFLGIPLGGYHLGCVVSAPPGSALNGHQVDQIATSFQRLARVDNCLRHETAHGQVWLWCSSPHQLPASVATELAVPNSLIAGVGRVHEGATGLRRTHLEAVDALRVARLSGAKGAVRIEDVALVAMLSSDPERARWFVERELSGLDGSDADAVELRRTLTGFFNARMRVSPAAENLFIHRNTLINRLERIEKLLGHCVIERTAEIQAALLLVATLKESEDSPPNAR